MTIENPYLMFLGDAADQLAAKVANGTRIWRPDWCIGQFRLPGCGADLGLPEAVVGLIVPSPFDYAQQGRNLPHIGAVRPAQSS